MHCRHRYEIENGTAQQMRKASVLNRQATWGHHKLWSWRGRHAALIPTGRSWVKRRLGLPPAPRGLRAIIARYVLAALILPSSATAGANSFDSRVPYGFGEVLAESVEDAHMVPVDLDGDGQEEIVATAKHGNAVHIWAQNGSGGLTIAVTLPCERPGQVAVADLDGDGRLGACPSNRNDGAYDPGLRVARAVLRCGAAERGLQRVRSRPAEPQRAGGVLRAPVHTGFHVALNFNRLCAVQTSDHS